MKPKGRSRKPKPATASLFEWALTVEMEREAEPIGAGHDAKGVALPNLGLPPLRPAPPLGGGDPVQGTSPADILQSGSQG